MDFGASPTHELLLTNDIGNRMGIRHRSGLAKKVSMLTSQSGSDVFCHEVYSSGRHRCSQDRWPLRSKHAANGPWASHHSVLVVSPCLVPLVKASLRCLLASDTPAETPMSLALVV